MLAVKSCLSGECEMATRYESVLEHDTNDSSVSEPHFDEEWTLLTARPVVPLNELKKTPVLLKVVKLVGVFAAAGLFGALVALASIRLRGETPRPIAQQDNVQENLDTPAETTGVVSTDVNNSESFASIQETHASVPVAKSPVRLTEATKRRTEDPILPQPAAREADSLKTIAAEVLAEPRPSDHWEEQRPRRVTNKRRTPQAERQASRTRGLGRIDEIFEGSPQRPEN